MKDNSIQKVCPSFGHFNLKNMQNSTQDLLLSAILYIIHTEYIYYYSGNVLNISSPGRGKTVHRRSEARLVFLKPGVEK